MDRQTCPRCGVEHDLSDMEPSYARPDAFLAVPPSERTFRTNASKDACQVRDAADTRRQFFLRVLLPMMVLGDNEDCCWGVWVEVDEAAYARVHELWGEAAQANEPPFPGVLANSLKGYEGTIGLAGWVHLTGPTSVPVFRLADSVQHLLATEQRDGVHPERVVEWLANLCGH